MSVISPRLKNLYRSEIPVDWRTYNTYPLVRYEGRLFIAGRISTTKVIFLVESTRGKDLRRFVEWTGLVGIRNVCRMSGFPSSWRKFICKSRGSKERSTTREKPNIMPPSPLLSLWVFYFYFLYNIQHGFVHIHGESSRKCLQVVDYTLTLDKILILGLKLSKRLPIFKNET